VTVSGTNSFTLSATDPNTAITITVTDGSGRCPADYQNGMLVGTNPTGFWDAANVYTKVVTE
jgi:hypothetical protein